MSDAYDEGYQEGRNSMRRYVEDVVSRSRLELSQQQKLIDGLTNQLVQAALLQPPPPIVILNKNPIIQHDKG